MRERKKQSDREKQMIEENETKWSGAQRDGEMSSELTFVVIIVFPTDFIQARRQALQQYVQSMIAHPEISHWYRAFFVSFFPSFCVLCCNQTEMPKFACVCFFLVIL